MRAKATSGQALSMVVRWLHEHPEHRTEDFRLLALAALLFQHAPGQEQRSRERLPQNLIPDDVPLDVADDAAKIGLELAQALVGALELMGVGVTLVLDQCQLADPSIGLAQAHPKLLRNAVRSIS